MEPELTKNISSKSVCTYYGTLTYLNAAVVIVALFGVFYAAIFGKMSMGSRVMLVIGSVLAGALSIVTYYLFPYLVCTRALLGEQKVILKKEGFLHSM